MCLRSKTHIPKVATEPIPVYKILIRTISDTFRTPYCGVIISKIPYMQEADETQVSVNSKLYPFFRLTYYEITTGYVHAYTDKQTAMAEIAPYKVPCVLVKGYVPEKALYFVGMDNDICATKIKLECITFEKSE